MVSWKDEANCARDNDPAWLGDKVTLSIAKKCWPCPVRPDCLFEALRREAASDPGVWGGLSPSERRHVRQDKTRLNEYWAELREAAA